MIGSLVFPGIHTYLSCIICSELASYTQFLSLDDIILHVATLFSILLLSFVYRYSIGGSPSDSSQYELYTAFKLDRYVLVTEEKP